MRGPAVILALWCAGCSVAPRTLKADRSDENPEPTPILVLVTGNQAVGYDELVRLAAIDLIPMSVDPTQAIAVTRAANRLARRYRFSGYADVDVEGTFEAEPGQIVVTFAITEGPRVTIESLEFEGNEAFSDDELLAMFLRREVGAFGLSSPAYVEEDIRTFAALIMSRYRGDGYLDAVVIPPETERSGTTTSIEIRIEEGELVTVGKTEVEPEMLEAMGEPPQLPDGLVASFDNLEALRVSIVNALRRRGYPEPRPRLEATRRTPTEIDFKVIGTIGKRGTVAAIGIEGNRATSADLIRGRLKIRTGQPYDGDAVDASVEALLATELFRDVEVRHEWLGPGRLRIVVEVQETLSIGINPQFGYHSYEHGRVRLDIVERNLFGTGQRLGAFGRLSHKGYRAGAMFESPYLFGSDASLRLEGSYFKDQRPSFTDKGVDASALFAGEVAPNLTLLGGYRIRSRHGAEVEPAVPVASVVDFDDAGPVLELIYDDRDHPIYPVSGFRAGARTAFAVEALGSDVEFAHLGLMLDGRVPLGAGFGLGLRAEMDWLWADTPLPIQVRLYNGGQDSVRSFRESRLGPTDAASQPIGGEYRNFFSVELGRPIVDMVDVHVFADAGNLGLRVEDYGFDDMRYAIGAGIELRTQVGPLRADWAWNPDRRSGEKTSVWHVSFGVDF